MSLRYTMSDVDTRDYRSVAFAINQLFHQAYPGADSFYIARLVTDVKEMFAGHFENLQAIDTHYHDIEHTLQAALCFTRLVVQRCLHEALPRIGAEDFKLGLVAVLLHDTGYLKAESDREGTGAKYTRIHEQRSCQYAAQYLQQFGWKAERIGAVQNMIRCTGPYADISAIAFTTQVERILGQAVCTADYIGQMSDPKYVDKLSHLFEEFEESDDFNGIPRKERLFSSAGELLGKTPDFWEKIVQPRMHVECNNLWKYLRLDDNSNPYIESVEANIAKVRRLNAERAAKNGA